MKNTLVKLLLAACLTYLIYAVMWERMKPRPAAGPAGSAAAVEPAGVKAGDTTAGETLLYAQADNRGQAPGSSLDSLEASLSSGRRTAIVRAAERAAPAVVSVNVLQTSVEKVPYRDFFGFFYVPQQRTVKNIGSGFIINPRGFILTNDHVVHKASKISISTSDGQNYEAKLIGEDENSDIALLKIEPQGAGLPVAHLGNSDNLYIGEWAIAIGSPFGFLLEDPQPTVTVGVISAIGRDIVRDQSPGSQVYANMIQTDAAINPGNSGGPLINALGEVIGINTFIFTPSGGSVGMGFAIPINRATRIAEDLIRGGKVRHPWLGIGVQQLTPELLAGLGYDRNERIQGVVVSNIQALSPAVTGAGLHPGDIISDINGRQIRSLDDWNGEMLDIRAGSPASLTILRGRSALTVNLTPKELPTDTVQRHSTGLGFDLIDLTAEVRSQLDARSDKGAVVVDITDSDLEREGSILTYDIIYRVNDVRITGAIQVVGLLKNLRRGQVAVLFIERDGRSIKRYVTG
ncbi:MAG: hypothetical protein A2Z86_09960 [Candidatus Glassbacteria bacterium GWA2_58_10]|uniref:PDZ domain-containing protein n=1 Tax=Candidatus Glassbacteria bacterium GWA2_58_10 TaxID=1817865 RepID=A0A1F5YDQ0_9BACT|nr:MAG: hypothetical protein A2Z86_09960 [Candidatus Glassbacteria bacterium GWA2_58_10]